MDTHRFRNPLAGSRFWATFLAVQLTLCLVLAGKLLHEAEPVALPDLALAEGERLQCVSYAPFHRPGQTPFDPGLTIARTQILEDLSTLRASTGCVRIYSVDQGLSEVPAVARELGLKVLLGAWIGSDPKRNTIELDRAIAIANAHPDVVRMLIVGNEVLLRRELTVPELRALIESARERSSVPVTYADVWEFWIRNRDLEQAVDRVTVHILPFWEDHPVAIETAVEHVADVFADVGSRFTKPVTIGETGWPSAGRQREQSRPSRVNQARFIREFVQRAHQEGWDYNLIEAIDQPWKRALEGTVGGHWGIFTDELEAKFPLTGPVSERHSILAPVLGAGAGALLCALLALRSAGRTGNNLLQVAASTACGASAGLLAVLHHEHATLAYRDLIEWSLLGTIACAGTLLALCLAGSPPGLRILPAWDAWRRLRVDPLLAIDPAVLSGLLRGIVLFAAAIAGILLFADPRYRDFPILLYLLPAAILLVAGWHPDSRHGREEWICSLVLALMVIGRWFYEPTNLQAIAWLTTGLALAAPTLRRPTHENEQG